MRAARWAGGARPGGRLPAGLAVLDLLGQLGELVARVTGRPVTEVLREQLLDPLGVTDTHLGLPREHWPRDADGGIKMKTDPLNLRDLLGELQKEAA